MVTREELIEFEKTIGDLFNNKKIKAPVHLYDGNEDKIIDIFKLIDIKNDWVCATWRNHYQCLLKGVSKEDLMKRIIDGKSMVMSIPEHKIYCSSIVGGIAPIATGIAYANKLNGINSRVWCWLGDMSAETGIFHESLKYSINFKLPITFIVEINNISVLTPVSESWGYNSPEFTDVITRHNDNLISYFYKNNKYPHAGAGMRIQF